MVRKIKIFLLKTKYEKKTFDGAKSSVSESPVTEILKIPSQIQVIFWYFVEMMSERFIV